MQDNDLSEKLRHELAPFSAMLYEEALEGDDADRSDGYLSNVCPLYMALDQIEERYGELEPIGTGGMKQVFRVFDALAARHVAMAMPREGLPSDSYDAFLREAHLTARLEHPCITRLFDMGIDPDGRPFFTMELMKGRSLRDVLRSLKSGKECESFPLLKRLSIFLRVCEAIAYAHSRRILHLDIKPENIQVGEYGEVHVCDWGLAVIASDDGDVHDSDVLLDSDLYCSLNRNIHGTPDYMAPERLNSLRKKSKQMDMYSLGCLLQELTTLKSPTRSVEDLRELAPGLAAVIQRAKSEKPERRYESVLELREEILRFISGFSTSAQHLSVLGECLLFYQRNRVPCRMAGSFLVLVIIGLSLAVHQIDGKRQEADAMSTRYLAEKLRAEERLRRQASNLFEEAVFLTQPQFIDTERLPRMVNHSIWQIERVLADSPQPDTQIWSQHFWLLFLSQNLVRAKIASERDVDFSRVSDLVELARKYAVRVNESGYLPADDLIDLFGAMQETLHPGSSHARFPLIERMLIYDTSYDRTIEEREKILATVLKMVNPDGDDIATNYDPETGALSLHGKSLVYLRMREGTGRTQDSLLQVFNPKYLDLRGTNISDLEELSGLEFIRLDVRQTPVVDLAPLKSIRPLREVVISPGQFDSTQTSALRSGVQFIEESP